MARFRICHESFTHDIEWQQMRPHAHQIIVLEGACMTILFSRIAGWVALLLGILGFFFTEFLDGLIQFDTWHNIAHLVIGLLGIAAAQKDKWARAYAHVFGVIYLLLGIIGFFLPELGHMHLEVSENLVHLVLGGFGIYTLLEKPKTSA
jgi:hypothetical protein